jgi:hypothetical protein
MNISRSPQMLEKNPERTTPGIWAMVVAALLLALLRLLAWMLQPSDPPENGGWLEPCSDGAEVARRTSRCSHPDHTGELVLVGQTTWLVCTCGKSDASTSDPKDPDDIVASID